MKFKPSVQHICLPQSYKLVFNEQLCPSHVNLLSSECANKLQNENVKHTVTYVARRKGNIEKYNFFQGEEEKSSNFDWPHKYP